MSFDTGIFLLWLVSSLFMMAGAGIAFWWACRSGQFRDQDRARYLALRGRIPGNEEVDSACVKPDHSGANREKEDIRC